MPISMPIDVEAILKKIEQRKQFIKLIEYKVDKWEKELDDEIEVQKRGWEERRDKVKEEVIIHPVDINLINEKDTYNPSPEDLDYAYKNAIKDE